MTLPLNLLDTMVYPDGSANIGIEVGTMYDSVGASNLQVTFAALVGALAIIAFLWVNLILLAWILENKHIIANRSIPMFKILTLGKLEASEVSALQIMLLYMVAALVIFLVVLGFIQKFIMFIVTVVLDIFDYLGGM